MKEPTLETTLTAAALVDADLVRSKLAMSCPQMW